MHKRLISLVFCFLALTAPLLAHADFPVPKPPQLDASSYILMDYHSGEILASVKPDQKVEPASITKLMTSYVVSKALKSGSISLDDKVLISEHAWRTPGSRMFVEVGTKVTVRNLMQGMIIQSGNDASVALAEYVAGSESSFVDLMNRYAQQLGMKNTHFMNATGLPHDDHYSTAHDIAKLARALIKEFPSEYDWYGEKDFTWNGIHQSNRNTLLFRDPSVDGLKTGHTDSAGYCLVASAERDGMRLVSVVMGTGSTRARADDSQALLNYGFRFFETHKLYDAGKELASPRVWKGAAEKVSLGLSKALYVTIPRGSYSKLKAFMDVNSQIVAPVADQAELGKVEVKLGDDTVASAPLHALNGVKEGGIWRRMVDSVLLWFK